MLLKPSKRLLRRTRCPILIVCLSDRVEGEAEIAVKNR